MAIKAPKMAQLDCSSLKIINTSTEIINSVAIIISTHKKLPDPG
jgi:hypothetical protein